MERTNQDWGLPGPHNSEGMADLWRMAADLDANALTDEQRARGERYIPIDAVEVRYDILPRADHSADRETVDRYLEVFDQLPGIVVQAATLILIDGLHRLEAAYRVEGRYHIRAVLKDVADADMKLEAFLANVPHGRSLTVAERKAMAQWLIDEMQSSDPGAWSNTRIAKVCALDRHTIAAMKPTRKRTASYVQSAQTGENTQSVQIAHSDDELDTPPAQPGFDDLPDGLPDDTPAPTFRDAPPAKPARSESAKAITSAYAGAAAWFRTYTPAIFQRVPQAAREKQRRALLVWRSWIDEALDVLDSDGGA